VPKFLPTWARQKVSGGVRFFPLRHNLRMTVMELGYLTPPLGLNLLMSSFRFGKSVPEVLSAVLPVVVVLSTGVLLITYVPALITALPKLFGY